jgi:GTP cyclohydrolase II
MNTPSALRLQKVAEADFPNPFGALPNLRISKAARRWRLEEAVVLEMGDLARRRRLRWCASTRNASPATCSTACAAIAARSLKWPSYDRREGRGLLIYEHQEGRGIGLLNKLRAYELQDQAPTPWRPTSAGLRFRSAQLRAARRDSALFRIEGVRLLSNNPGEGGRRGKPPACGWRSACPIVPAMDSTRSVPAHQEREDGALAGRLLVFFSS